MSPLLLLRIENAGFFALSLWAYSYKGGGWLMFALLFLVPDLSMIGYAVNPRTGAAIYNLIHTYIGPFALGAAAPIFGHSVLMPLALIWTAHIAFDRMLAFGLKYPTRFKDTHLSPERHRTAGAPSA